MGTRIAILGGGISALAAAYEIKRADPANVFDITIYQMGWRLGGKCASSRNLSGGMDFRNEEHGLHVLGGWYHNTFEMMRNVYADWQSLGHGDTAAFADAFLPLNGAVLFDRRKNILGVPTGWRKIAVRFPPPRGEPGLDVPDLTLKVMGRRLLEWVRHILRGSPDNPSPFMPLWKDASGPADAMAEVLDRFDAAGAADWDEAIAEEVAGQIDTLKSRLTLGVEETVKSASDKGTLDALIPSFVGPRGGLSAFDYACLAIIGLVMARGMLRDKLFARGLDDANEEETMAWLKRHGAPRFVIESPFVELGYHYAFSYIDGDPKRPNMAAGTALRGYLRMLFGQSGSFFYHFNGGIGDVLIKPLYDVLKARGVKFEFFCDVRAVEAGASRRIETIRIRRQAKVSQGAGQYAPLFALPDGMRVWPDRPLLDQLMLSPGQERFPADFEDPEDVGPGDPEETLVYHRDFDLAILAIPGTSLKTICRSLATTSRRWRAYLGNVWSSPTLSAQVWTRSSTDDLGWANMPPITTGHVLPLSTWCDMSHHLAFETPSTFNALHFLCGPHMPGREDPRQQAERWLTDHFGDVLPRWQARRENLTPRSLFVKLNTHPSDLYIFSPAGSVRHRMRCDQSDFANLLLCGDWIRNGTDLGWVEGAVTAARQCSRVLTYAPARIYGETDFG